VIDGKAVRTIDMQGARSESASELLLTLLVLLPITLFHCKSTSSPPLKAMAFIALGETNNLASSQPFPASSNSDIWSCCGLLETSTELSDGRHSLGDELTGEARGEGERRPLPFLPFLGVDIKKRRKDGQ